jgi:hypothetical protein
MKRESRIADVISRTNVGFEILSILMTTENKRIKDMPTLMKEERGDKQKKVE